MGANMHLHIFFVCDLNFCLRLHHFLLMLKLAIQKLEAFESSFPKGGS